MSRRCGTSAGVEWLRGHLEESHGIAVVGLSRPQAWNPHVLRVDRADGAAWIARVFDELRPVERAEGDAAVLQWLEEIGFPAERCATDHPVSTHGDHAVLVTEFVDGVAATSAADDLTAIGERLGRLHALEAIPAACSREGGAWHGDPAFEGAPGQDIAHAVALVERIEHRVPLHLRDRVDDLRARLARADDCADLPHSLLHPDPGPVNAIVSADQGMVLIDWTGAGTGPRIASLALVLLAAPDAVAAGYRRHVDLEPDELERIGEAIRIRTLFWTAYYLDTTLASGTSPSGREDWWPDDDAVDAAAATARTALRSR